jgi:glycosyltransferase involved in cell wall biosynthesis
MKIGYVYPFEAFPPRGGNRVHAYQLIRGFLRQHHEIFTLGDGSMPDVRAFESSIEGARALARHVDVLYVRVDANHLTRDPVLVSLLNTGGVPLVLELNAPANESLAFSWLGGRTPQPGAVSRSIDTVRRTLHAARKKPGIAREEAFRKKIGSKVRAAICVSESVGRYASEFLGIGTIRVIPNGSDPVANHPGREPVSLSELDDQRFKVLFAGSPMYPWQGLDLVMEAAANSDSMLYLLLLNQRLRGTAPDNVRVLEKVRYEDVGRYICTADACLALQPDFTWSPWGFHGSPMKLFDYMACGRPIVTTGVGQLGEIIRRHDNGLICSPDGPDIVDKLSYLREHPREAARMGENSRQAVLQHYNWEHITELTLEVLQSAVKEGLEIRS